jgi:hypothetical protein
LVLGRTLVLVTNHHQPRDATAVTVVAAGDEELSAFQQSGLGESEHQCC